MKSAAVFAEAEAAEVARIEGLDLRLPGVSLKEKKKLQLRRGGRGVRLVARGGLPGATSSGTGTPASRTGGSSRCNRRCSGSWRSGGSWRYGNDREFRAFRESVIRLRLPVLLHSCSLAPCDYVQTEGFEQDCHIRNVQRGRWMWWCMGVFQCMRVGSGEISPTPIRFRRCRSPLTPSAAGRSSPRCFR